ncbi:fasciclin domain-containing protein [Roseovarius aquimarinus]|uniref:Fasciclin domain-containing protein n=1 Tax=Roseovarius aquimarinus TaxID=1229156 RepID=A0ABW7I5E7_9RHOB
MPAQALGWIKTYALFCVPLAVLVSISSAAQSERLGEQLADDERFDTVSSAMSAAGFGGDLESGPVTFFAPTDEAFERLPQAVADGFGEPWNAEAIRRILSLHVVPGGPHASQDLPVEMRTLSGDRLVATYTAGALTLQIAPPDDAETLDPLIAARASNEARIRAGDIAAGENAVIHAIDRVLLPPEFDMADAGIGKQTAGDEERRAKSAQDDEDFVKDIASVDDGASPDLEKTPTEAVDAASQTYAAARDGDRAAGDVVPEENASQSDLAEPVTLENTTENAPEIVTLPQQDAPEQDNRPETPERKTEGADTTALQSPSHNAPALELTGDTVSVAELIGKPVRRADGSQLGVVSDLLVTLDGARIETLVVETDDGLFGLGDPETQRVNIRAVSVDPLDGAVMLQNRAGDDRSEGAE